MRDHGILDAEVPDRRGKIRLVRENGGHTEGTPRGVSARTGRAEVRGLVRSTLARDGTPVEYGAPLFAL